MPFDRAEVLLAAVLLVPIWFRRNGRMKKVNEAREGETSSAENSCDPEALMLSELVRKNRSVRRFHEEVAIDVATLKELVDLARLSASAGNLQPLKYVLVCDPETNALVFPHLAWAGYLQPAWTGPAKGERPSAYIIILGDTEISKVIDCDHGIAAQTILLGATERGLAGCIIGSVERHGLQKALGIPPRYDILLVIALGKPKEKVVIETAQDGNIRYWRDAEGVHHVPKRPLDEIILTLPPREEA